ncbi:hypothetical protein [Pontimicrobium sp. SW4]|uniref:HNH endonuclease n=1 Tax=Pontimicrobium sp. SW4 TaxID=3153519 RepID=A0AAU7BPY4_9FLAO
MLALIRPKRPWGFQTKAKEELKKVENQLASDPKKIDFNDSFWGKYKPFFNESQYRKCGYCESYMNDYGDVEHYRPKSVIQEIKSEGEEQEDAQNVRQRRFKNACKRGYWWLAYHWDNYLLSCKLCNQPWKRALFPISNERPKNTGPDLTDYPFRSPKKSDNETPLLLNPFDHTDFSKHFEFTDTGLIKPFNGSEVGLSTIITCGLHRPSLVQFRNRTAKSAYRYMIKFAISEAGSEDEIEAATELIELGHHENNYAGMVRIIFEQESGKSWEELVQFVENFDNN